MKAPMSPEEFKLKMEELSKDDNWGRSHLKADHLMGDVLRDLGYGQGVLIFNVMQKFYE